MSERRGSHGLGAETQTDLEETMKQQLPKDIILKKPFMLTAILLAAIWFFGCGPTLQERRLETQRLALEGQKEAVDNVARWKERFLNCMRDYAVKNARTSASASEISDEAASECQFYLSVFGMNEESYHMNTLLAGNPDVPSEWAREKGEEKTRFDVQELTEQGKQLVVNILVKIRQ